jgi:hypothetical protein
MSYFTPPKSDINHISIVLFLLFFTLMSVNIQSSTCKLKAVMNYETLDFMGFPSHQYLMSHHDDRRHSVNVSLMDSKCFMNLQENRAQCETKSNFCLRSTIRMRKSNIRKVSSFSFCLNEYAREAYDMKTSAASHQRFCQA